MATIAHTNAGRVALYRSLVWRNRVVDVLRIVVPLIGLVLVGILGVQLVLSNLSAGFVVGRVSVVRNQLVVEAPTYSGLLADGSSYTVTALSAEAPIEAANLIDLTDMTGVVTRTDGVTATLVAASAKLDSQTQVFDVADTAKVTDSTGASADLLGLHIDASAQMVTAQKTIVRFVGGEVLEADTMTYDATTQRWVFAGVTMSLPKTPGEAEP